MKSKRERGSLFSSKQIATNDRNDSQDNNVKHALFLQGSGLDAFAPPLGPMVRQRPRRLLYDASEARQTVQVTLGLTGLGPRQNLADR